MAYAKKILTFLKGLHITEKLPAGVQAMNPYQNEETFRLCRQFYTKYYNDIYPRTIILGINPGRFGAGLTGIPFTDPMKLEDECGIKNIFPKKRELSADFIYQMIHAFGGKQKFYAQFYFGSVSPLGFVKGGKNLNYYDDPKLQKAVLPFILKALRDQVAFGLNTEVAYCLGEGMNYAFLSKLNEQHGFFKRLIPLSHPRFIMQYKRKQIDYYLNDYLSKLSEPHSFIP